MWHLIDTDFRAYLFDKDRNIQTITFCLIKEYQRRNLPVAPNVVALYKQYKWHLRFDYPSCIETQKKLIDVRYPELKYGKEIYPCVLNEFDKLKWIGK